MHLSQPVPLRSQSSFQPVSSNHLFVSSQHREILAALSRTFAGPPCFSALTGAPGLGLTTLLNMAAAGWPGPVRFSRGAAQTVLSDLAALSDRPPGTAPGLLVIDDAHDLAAATLERLAALAGSPSLPHVVLAGRTELWTRLREPALNRLDRHIVHRSVLFPMPYAEAKEYLRHLFRLAGGSIDLVLPGAAQHSVLLHGRGNVRRINEGLVAALPAGAVRIRLPAPKRRSRWHGLVRRLAAGGLAAATVALAGLAVAVPEVFSGWPRAVPVSPTPVADAKSRPGPPAARPTGRDQGTAFSQPTEGPMEQASPSSPIETEPGAAAGSVQAAGPQRPAQPIPGAPVRQAAPAPNVQDDLAGGLILRGDALLTQHDILGARRYYERAAMSGGSTLRAKAAAALAATFDPAQRKALAPWDARTDAAIALAWYRVAASLGSDAARASVKRLEGARP